MPTIGEVVIKFTADTRNLQGQIDNLKKEIRSAGTSMSRSFKEGATGSRDWAGALRTLNGGFDIRSLSRYIAGIKELRGALTVLVPAIAGIAAFELFDRMINKVEEFEKRVNELPKRLKEGFGQLVTAQNEANDKLQVSNDKLANQIAKLEHKPVNAVKEALDEAREASDSLASSIQQDIDKMQQLLDKNTISAWDSFWDKGIHSAATMADLLSANIAKMADFLADVTSMNSNVIPDTTGMINRLRHADLTGNSQNSNTAESEKVKQDNEKMSNMQFDAAQASNNAKFSRLQGDNKTAATQQKIADTLNLAIQALRMKIIGSESAMRAKIGDSPADDARRKTLDTNIGVMKGGVVRDSEGQQNAADTAKVASLESTKALNEAAIAKAKKDWEDQFAHFKDYHDRIDELYNFWESRAQKSSGELKALAQKNADEIYFAGMKENSKTIEDGRDMIDGIPFQGVYGFDGKQRTVPNLQSDSSNATVSKDKEEGLVKDAENTKRLATANEQFQNAIQAASFSYQEVAIKNQEATGMISKHQAALAIQAVHEQEYQKQLDKLKTAMANATTPIEKQNIQEQLINATAQHKVTSEQDANDVNNTTQWNQFYDSMREWSISAQNYGRAIAEVVTSTLDSLNKDILSSSKNHKEEFQKTGADMFRSLGEAGLKSVEGKAMSALFGTKGGQLGSRGNPIYNIPVSGGGASSSSSGGILGGLLRKLHPGSSGSGSDGSDSDGSDDSASDGDSGWGGSGGGSSSVSSSSGGILGGLLKALGIGGSGGNGGGSGSSGDSDSDSGSGNSGIGSIFGTILSGLHFADGGDPPVGQASIVGEEGPELFMPRRAGTIVPNGGLGGGTVNYHIDARGASAAEVEQRVHASLVQVHGSAVRSSMQAQSEQRRRSPTSNKR
jgi:hypothetical protein